MFKSKHAIPLLLLAMLFLGACGAGSTASGIDSPSVSQGQDISAEYLDLARLYREQGRFELARQTYVQALATCRDTANLNIIKRELAGVELLIRTMR